MDLEYDYIVIGGGLTGCALSSRLHHNNPSLKILLIEAGPDPHGNQLTSTATNGSLPLAGSEFDWFYSTTPQPHTNNRVHSNNAGKALGGGSIINYGGWARGDASDYDEWARAVGDEQWSYSGLLPFFRRSENFHDFKANPEQHGFEGPMHVVSVSASDPKRVYGLRQPLLDAWTELGVKHNPDPSPSIAGISEPLENWRDGLRQPSSLAYGLEGVQVLTESMVQSVLFSESESNVPRASGVLLVDGRKFSARKEIVLSAGSFRTPQILMLSGLGPTATLKKFDISVVVDMPEVGENLFDHFALFQFWKVRNPEKGYALGNPSWNDKAYDKGFPWDWLVNEAVPSDLLKPAVEEDNSGTPTVSEAHNLSLLQPSRPHLETAVIYGSAGVPGIPVNGTIIASSVMLLIPTSRGSISISSASAADRPVLDPNYYSTQTDRVSLIHGTRRLLQALLDTHACKDYIESEVPPPGFPVLTPKSTDEEIDARIRGVGVAHAHAMGSVAMGKVVDTELRVKNVQGLRVVDASVFPVAIGGHPQATLYAIAEKAAVLMLHSL